MIFGKEIKIMEMKFLLKKIWREQKTEFLGDGVFQEKDISNMCHSIPYL
ncbi:hypothetical protein F383_29931 [Gossypium arboreum]|uniref:Uncharacterized protein n=1 Tax=Gossypium arboreum TaxID=29729 RepID=A0A0B0PCB7_GOSAR|nr:hypothetical protein F383_29931 [Gossypium arboreum]